MRSQFDLFRLNKILKFKIGEMIFDYDEIHDWY